MSTPTMQDTAWLERWVPDGLYSQMRFAPSIPHEQSAASGALVALTTQIMTLAYAIDNRNEEAGAAVMLTAMAAVLADHVEAVSERTGRTVDSTITEWDDSPPEVLRAVGQVTFCAGVARGLATRAKERLEADALGPAPPWDDEAAQDEMSARQGAAAAHAAALSGNAAALEWHLDRMEALEGEPTCAQMDGHVIALWHNRINLIGMEDWTAPPGAVTELEGAAGSMLREAREAAETATQRAGSDRLADLARRHRPMRASIMASQPEARPAGEALVAAVPEHPYLDSVAVYQWVDGAEAEALMAYRYQGCTHLKLVTEPYGHPVDQGTSLQHCSDLEDQVSESLTAGEPANEAMMHQAILNRSLALAGLATTAPGEVQKVIERTKIAFDENTRTESMTRIIAGGYFEAAQHLITVHDVQECPLNEEQARTVVQAARASGASDTRVREMAIRLGMTHEDMEAAGITRAKRIPWDDASAILEMLYWLRSDPGRSWEEAAKLMGWKPESAEVTGLLSALEAGAGA